MGRYTRRILAVLGIALLASMFASQAIASAQEDYPPPPPVPGTLIVPPTVLVGGEIAVSGNSCGANQSVTISFNGVPVATATTDPSGHFAVSFPVPAGTTPGVYTVTASNSACVLSGVIQVEAATAVKLAFTGSSSSIPTLWVGVGLVGLGAGLVFVARRRLSGAVR
jgi:LPXTG-motif cell wall-anchored protein